jgi:hypothetical protein
MEGECRPLRCFRVGGWIPRIAREIGQMKRFTDAVGKSLATNNSYGALLTALALPDICGWLENPEAKSTARYIGWCDRFLTKRYTAEAGPNAGHVFLAGGDAYALRCALLHEGGDGISRQKARVALTKFQFVVTPPGITIHKNQNGSLLQLQVDIFCADICFGVAEWTVATAANADVQTRKTELISITSV